MMTTQKLEKAELINETHVLLIDDCDEDVEFIRHLFSHNQATHIYTYKTGALTQAAVHDVPSQALILLSVDLGTDQGQQHFKTVRQLFSNRPLIILSHNPDEDLAIQALQHGAQDYLLKSDLTPVTLTRATRYAIERHEHQLNLLKKTEALTQVFHKLKQANQDLRQLATIDGLTQIFNRRHFDQALTSEWQRAARNAQPVSLILCDIDFFKAYNDTYGHRAGDYCLRSVAQTISTAAQRSVDTVARYGGEEFVIVLPNTTTTGAVKVAQNIQAALSQAQLTHHSSLVSDHVTMSFGVATQVPRPNMTPDDLVEAADQALYIAKEKGRNCIQHSPTHCALPKRKRTHRAVQRMSAPTPVLRALNIAS